MVPWQSRAVSKGDVNEILIKNIIEHIFLSADGTRSRDVIEPLKQRPGFFSQEDPCFRVIARVESGRAGHKYEKRITSLESFASNLLHNGPRG